MKLQRCFLFTAIFLSLTFSLNGQCGNIILYTQSDVDSFAFNTDTCTHVGDLVLQQCDSCDIVNLDGLNQIKFISKLIIKCNSIKSLSGFQNLKKVNELSFETDAEVIGSFPDLDTVQTLAHKFNTTILDLKIYNNVRHIENLELIGEGQFNGLANFEPHISLFINIRQNTSGVSISPILKNYTDHIEGVNLDRSSINIDILRELRSINKLALNKCLLMNVEPILKIPKIGSFVYWQGDGDELDFGQGFSLDSLNELTIQYTTHIISIRSLFPNLKAVKHRLKLYKNKNLTSIDITSDFPELIRGGLSAPYRDYLNISYNPKLETCSNAFICHAVRTIPSPDSLALFANGRYCNYDSLNNENCLTVSTSDFNKELLQIYPNPVYDKLFIKNNADCGYFIFNSTGRLVQSGTLRDDHIVTQDLQCGIYTVHIIYTNTASQAKFIKLD